MPFRCSSNLGASHVLMEVIPPAPPADGAPSEEEDERLCRYCFEGDEEGELISPCSCKGGQKWVHTVCLRRWQRMVLVSQPTHPAFYRDDVRHHKCNVCGAAFTNTPPTRHELMESFTGSEIAALLEPGYIIGAAKVFSDELARQLMGLPAFHRDASGYEHWIRGCYLITSVDQDNGRVEVPVETNQTLAFLRRAVEAQDEEDEEEAETRRDGRADSRLGSDDEGGSTEAAPSAAGAPAPAGGAESNPAASRPLELTLRGKRFRIMPEGALAGTPDVDLRHAFGALRAPCAAHVVLAAIEYLLDGSQCGNDHIAAVNLARPIAEANLPDRAEVGETLSAARKRFGDAAVEALDVEHYRGGPVGEDEIDCCVVLGGGGAGWTVVKDLHSAIRLALSRAGTAGAGRVAGDDGSSDGGAPAAKRQACANRPAAQGGVCGGQTVRLRGLQARADLNDELGLALRFNAAAGRWLVRLRNGEGKRVKPANLEPLQGSGGRVFVFWGNAAWSRTQLLGEIARGHWGLCKASVAEVISPVEERWAGLDGRMAFAPITAMTEDFVATAQREMEAVRVMAAGAAVAEPQEQEEPPLPLSPHTPAS